MAVNLLGAFNEAQVVKCIKHASRKGDRLGACLMEGYYYVTNGYWLIRFLPIYKKIISAVIVNVGLIKEGAEYMQGSLRLTTESVKKIFDQKTGQENQEEIQKTPWVYQPGDGPAARIVTTSSGRQMAFNKAYMDMFDSCKLMVGKDALIAYHLDIAVGVVMCFKVKDNQTPPTVGVEGVA